MYPARVQGTGQGIRGGREGRGEGAGIALIEDVRENRAADWQHMDPSVVVIARQGQKIKISQDYWVLDCSTGTPQLREC